MLMPTAAPIKKFSLVIPAHNEEGVIEETLQSILEVFQDRAVELEILVVNDNSQDGTEALLQQWSQRHPQVRYVNNKPPHGFGHAVRCGLDHYTGDAVAIVMADGSDAAADMLVYFHRLDEGVDCVFGSRFIRGGQVIDYPWFKLIINRLANLFIQVLFGLRFNDVTNAFKAYRREVIEGCRPLLSHHFNLTVEIPLKAIIRGYTFGVVPIRWTNRKAGESKLRLKEMGSRYLFVVLYVLMEKWLSKGDYFRKLKED
jgi:dolichol-phosphate mannosyltransferase